MDAKKLWGYPSLTIADLNAGMVERCDKWLGELLQGKKPIPATTIFITCNGGLNAIGVGLYDRLAIFQDLLNIHLVAVGAIGSAAQYVSLAVPRRRRFLTPHTTVFLHQTQQDYTIPYKGSLSAREQHIAEIKSDLRNQRRHQRWMVSLIAREMHRTTTWVEQFIATEAYLTAREAVRYGLFSSIISPAKK